jgi:hemoglobin-like flavoprotein
MNATQRRLVRESWAQLMPIKEEAAALFYGRLFERYPEVKAYFNGDMLEQGRKLMQILDTAVSKLDELDELSPTLRELGRRHGAYGVTDADYDKVAEALLWTLQQGIGEAFTPDVEAAWVATYTSLAKIMKAGAASTRGPRGDVGSRDS